MAMKKKTGPKKAVVKKAAAPRRKAAKAAKAAKAEKAANEKKEPEDVESLESILAEADRAFSDIVKRYYALGRCYVKAVKLYGLKGRKAFIARFPLTDNALRNLELVGTGKLLPHFAMCSNKFTVGIVNMVDSMMWQRKLASCATGNVVRVVREDGTVSEMSLEDFLKDANAVMATISEADSDLSPEELAEKIEKMRSDARAHFVHHKNPPYVVKTMGDKKVVRFFKSIPYDADGLKKILDEIS